MKKRNLAKRILALGLGSMLAVTSVPYIGQAAKSVEAEAADNTIKVQYTVQVKKDKASFQNIFNKINSARRGSSNATADSSASIPSDTDLKWNSDLEEYAIERAKDIALFNNGDNTRPNGKSDMTLLDDYKPTDTNIKDETKKNVTAFVTYVGAENSTPDAAWVSSPAALSTSNKSAAIGHVSYGKQEYYCLILSSDDTNTEDFNNVTLDYSNTGYTTPQVKRDLAYKNIGTIYARYRYQGVTDYDPLLFTDGNGISTAKFPNTISVDFGKSVELPTIISYAVAPTTSGSTGNSANVYDIADSTKDVEPAVSDSKGIDVTGSNSGYNVAGKAVGNYTASYVATIVGKKTSLDIPVTVTAADLSDASISLSNPSEIFYANGKASEPAVKITYNNTELKPDTDYTLSYKDNKPANTITTTQTATVTATGKGNFKGTIEKTFQIQPSTGGKLSEATINVTEKNIVYDGKEKKPKATVTLHGETVPESSYTLSYANNVKAGTATIMAKAKSGDERYSGVAKGTFAIAQADLSTADFTFADSDNKSNTSPQYSYTGADIKPEPTIKVDSLTLVKNSDFTYSYAANKAIGTSAAVTVTGKGNFTGQASMNFEITQGDITKATVTATPSTFDYNGQKQYPTVVMVAIGNHQLTKGVDYTISPFPESINPGTYTYTITGINNFRGTGTTTANGTTSITSTANTTGTTSTTGTTTSTTGNTTTSDKAAGTITASYTITSRDASKDSQIAISKPAGQTYNGKAKKPAVTVSDNKVGRVLTEGTDYTRADSNNKLPGTGTITLTFQGGYTGTVTLNYSIKPKKTSLSKVTAGKKKATVTYKKVSGISGYQVKAGTNRAVTKSTKTKTTSKTKYTMKSLEKGKRYYFKVRTYYTGTNGKRSYSSWSNVRSAKIK